jgi:hypothetical protein
LLATLHITVGEKRTLPALPPTTPSALLYSSSNKIISKISGISLLLAQQLQAQEDELALQLERAQISDRRNTPSSDQNPPDPNGDRVSLRSIVQQPDPTSQKPKLYPSSERKKDCIIM